MVQRGWHWTEHLAPIAGTETSTEPSTDLSSLSGEIFVSGSSTVEPISIAAGNAFGEMAPGVALTVEGPGTGDGFAKFCAGETDISDASRAIDPDEEIPACEDKGIDFIEIKVAIDGLSVITSADNDMVDCLDFYDLYALLGPESEGFKNWSDADALAGEIGAAHAPYPDEPLVVTAPGEESGTYDSFAELVLEDIAVEERKQPEDGPFVRSDYQSSGDDSIIVEGISGNETSLGWVGYAFFKQNDDTVRALGVSEKGSDGCVEPTEETIRDGSYPIARDLYIYVNAAKAEENPAVSGYVDYYLSEAGLASVAEVGYVDLHDEDLQESVDAWEARETGSREE